MYIMYTGVCGLPLELCHICCGVAMVHLVNHSHSNREDLEFPSHPFLQQQTVLDIISQCMSDQNDVISLFSTR